MRPLLALTAILLSLSGFAQKKDTLVRYFNASLEPVRKKEAVFVGVAVKDIFGWNAIVYNDSLKVIMRGKYTNEDCKIKDGWFIYYDHKGERNLAGKYTQNMKNDLWLTWYPSGQIRDSVFFLNDLAHGPSRKYFESGLIESTGYFRNGIIDSVWEWYHENGRRAALEKYTKGTLASFECFDTTGTSIGMNCAINRPPAIKGKYGGVEKYVSDSIRYSEKMKLTEISFVTVQFTVNKEGRMSEPRVINPANKSLSDEIIRVLKSIPGWYPAVSHNRTVEHTYTLNISFFPENQGVQVQEISNSFYNQK
jgi:antitoxin component YwqK of YwqJK toxin-antitoxin module